MTNHPNRSQKGNKAANPKPGQVLKARNDSGLTQTEAAALIHCSWRTWQDWEAGKRRMHPAFWELFNLKVKHQPH